VASFYALLPEATSATFEDFTIEMLESVPSVQWLSMAY
jgi:hypothetical protein